MNPPPILYKYASASTGITILDTGRLRWSSPLLFNDLSEFQRMPRFEPTVAESYPYLAEILVDAAFGSGGVDVGRLSRSSALLLALVKQLVDTGFTREELVAELTMQAPGSDEKIAAGLRAAFDKFDPNSARVLCLTTNFENEAMWANYAGGHTGIVLGFQHLAELDTPLLVAKPVEYTELPPSVGSGLDFLLYGDSPELREKTLAAVCYSKKLAWSYEKEWRVVTWRRKYESANFADYKFYPKELESVTLGPRTSAESESVVRKLLQERYKHCALFALRIQNGVASRVML